MSRESLKDEVDASDAKETIDFYNIILQQIDKVVASPANPRDIAFNECINALMESAYPLSIEEIFKTASERNPQVARYIGNLYKLDHNKRLRPVLEMLKNHSRVKIVQMKPIVLQYMPEPSTNEGINKGMSSDPYDPYALPGDTHVQKLGPETSQNNCTQVSDHRADRSDRSDSEDRAARLRI